MGIIPKSKAFMSKDNKPKLLLDSYFKELDQLSERLKEWLKPAHEMREQAQKSIDAVLEAQRSAQAAAERLTQSVQIPDFVLPDFSIWTNQATELGKAIEDSISPIFKQIQESFHELPPRTRKTLLSLAERGWFLDLDMAWPAVLELEEALLKGEVTEVEEALCDYFEDRLPEIEKSIAARLPHRTHLIRAAFDAHRRGEYVLSIPLILAQVDGICKEVMGQYLFIRRDKKPGTAKYVEQLAADSFMAALLSPLAQTTPINASEAERVKGFDALNRHMVLHGEDLNYGSKRNGLKAISLINFVAHVVPPAEEQKKP
jgi:hypothetical protein